MIAAEVVCVLTTTRRSWWYHRWGLSDDAQPNRTYSQRCRSIRSRWSSTTALGEWLLAGWAGFKDHEVSAWLMVGRTHSLVGWANRLNNLPILRPKLVGAPACPCS